MVKINKKQQIMQTAQALFYSKGYENTSVQNIIEPIGVAKGTFYHHFKSKEHLLDEVIEEMFDAQLPGLEELVEDTSINAIEKFEKFFKKIGMWKVENKDFFKEILVSFYKTENTVMRYKMVNTTMDKISPLINKIIAQGVEEKLFNPDFPDDMGEVILKLSQMASDEISQIILNDEIKEKLELIIKKITLCEKSIEKLLDAKPNSFKLFDIDLLKEFI